MLIIVNLRASLRRNFNIITPSKHNMLTQRLSTSHVIQGRSRLSTRGGGSDVNHFFFSGNIWGSDTVNLPGWCINLGHYPSKLRMSNTDTLSILIDVEVIYF